MHAIRNVAILGLAAAGALATGCSGTSDSGANSTTSAVVSSRAGESATASAPAGAPTAAGPATQAAGADTKKIATPAGEFTVQGAILQKYNAFGGSSSPLGLPTSNEQSGPHDGRYSTFDGGAIYWTPQTGAHVVWGGIRTSWEQDGGPSGALGYPTSDEKTIPGGWESNFQHGTITYTDGPHIQTR